MESARLNRSLGFREGVALSLARLSAMAIQRHDLVPAARLLGAAAAQREPNCCMASDERAEYAHTLAVVRSQLNECAFTDAWAKGQAMTLEQAIAYALEEAPAATEETPPRAVRDGLSVERHER